MAARQTYIRFSAEYFDKRYSGLMIELPILASGFDSEGDLFHVVELPDDPTHALGELSGLVVISTTSSFFSRILVR
jgi:hypothetical protein